MLKATSSLMIDYLTRSSTGFFCMQHQLKPHLPKTDHFLEKKFRVNLPPRYLFAFYFISLSSSCRNCALCTYSRVNAHSPFLFPKTKTPPNTSSKRCSTHSKTGCLITRKLSMHSTLLRLFYPFIRLKQAQLPLNPCK